MQVHLGEDGDVIDLDNTADAETIAGILGVPWSTVRYWAQARGLQPQGRGRDGRTLYRIGDAAALAATRRARVAA